MEDFMWLQNVIGKESGQNREGVKGVQRKEPVRIGLEKSILSFGIKSRGGMKFSS